MTFICDIILILVIAKMTTLRPTNTFAQIAGLFDYKSSLISTSTHKISVPL